MALGFIDDWSSVLIRGYEADAQHLLNPHRILIETEPPLPLEIATVEVPADDKLVCLDGSFRGFDTPIPDVAYSQLASGGGEELTHNRVPGREFSIPIGIPTSTRQPYTDLMKHLFAKRKPLIVAFKRPNAADTRYLIGCKHLSGPDRQTRGATTMSNGVISFNSAWSYAITPQTEAAGVPFVTSGLEEILWGVELTNITADTQTITVVSSDPDENGSEQLGWRTIAASAAVRPSRVFVSPSPPYRQRVSMSSATEINKAHRVASVINSGAGLPQYLTPDRTYTITVTGAANVTLRWCKNYAEV